MEKLTIWLKKYDVLQCYKCGAPVATTAKKYFVCPNCRGRCNTKKSVSFAKQLSNGEAARLTSFLKARQKNNKRKKNKY